VKKVASIAVALLLSVSAAHAQDAPARREPSAGDLATARNALKEGLALREKGDLPGSLGRLATAFDIVQTPVTAFELGKANMMVGKVLTASELFTKVGRMQKGMEESERSEEARRESARLVKELEPRIPSLRIKLTIPPVATAVVRVDDEKIALVKAGETVRVVDPGAHVVAAKAGDGPEQVVKIELAESETKDVALTPQWVEPKEPDHDASGKKIIYVKQTNPLTFVFFGLASASLVFDVFAGTQYVTRNGDVADHCTGKYCAAHIDEDIRAMQTWGLLFLVGGISTLTFVSVGTFFAANPSKEKVVVGVGPGTATLQGRF